MRKETIKIDEELNLMLMSRHMELISFNDLYAWLISSQNPYPATEEHITRLENKIIATSVAKQEILSEVERLYKPSDLAVNFNVNFENSEVVFEIND